MGKGGFSWKRLTGITKAKQKVSRKTGIPLTKSGRQRKIGKIVTGGKGCLVTILLPILFILMLIFVNVSTHSQDSDAKQLKQGSELAYTIVDEQTYDIPIVTRVTQRIVINGDFTKENIGALLVNLYEDISNRSGYKYNEHPDAIFIWAYTSEEKERNNYWIAMISKSPNENEPSLQFDKTELSLSDASEEEINGLSENKRKEIFRQVYQAYTQAEDEGDRMYPIDDPELSLEQMKQRIDASRAYSDKIKNKENKKITAKYKITTEQIKEILNEGLIKHWSRK